MAEDMEGGIKIGPIRLFGKPKASQQEQTQGNFIPGTTIQRATEEDTTKWQTLAEGRRGVDPAATRAARRAIGEVLRNSRTGIDPSGAIEGKFKVESTEVVSGDNPDKPEQP